MSHNLTLNRPLLREILVLSGPAVLEQLCHTAVTYADTAMVGRLGAHASAAVGLTGSVVWLVCCIFSAVGMGSVALISRSIGGGRKEQARIAAAQSLWLALCIGVVMGAAMVGIHRVLPVWMNAEPELVADAGLYFMIICLPMPLRGVSILCGCVLRGAGDTRSPMRINLIMNLTNIALNFLLIYPSRSWRAGELTIPILGAGWGIAGAAIATAISLALGGVLMLIAMQRNELVRLSRAELRVDKPVLREILRVGLPVVAQRVIACLGYITFASLVACLGTIPLAANSIATSAEELFYVAGYGVQAAAATMAGNALGELNERKFRTVSCYCCVLTVLMLAVAGAVLFAFPGALMSLFTSDQEVIQLGVNILRIVALTEPIYGIMVVLEGVFDGIGDTRAPVVYSLVTMWGVRIFCSALCIHVFHLGLQAVWYCMVADNVLRAALLLTRYLRKKWKYRFVEDNPLYNRAS